MRPQKRIAIYCNIKKGIAIYCNIYKLNLKMLLALLTVNPSQNIILLAIERQRKKIEASK